MNKSVFVDTNIIIDAAVPGRGHHNEAVLFEHEVAYSNVQAFIAATSLKDAYFLIKRATDEAFAREYVQCLMRLYAVATVDAATCEDAVCLNEPDFEDGIIRACAEGLGTTYIISRDEHAFKHSNIKRMTAQEYLDEFADVELTDFPAL